MSPAVVSPPRILEPTQPPAVDQPEPGRAVSVAPAKIPWQLWCGLLATTSSTVGFEWDFAWHRSIGRDGFWTPAHVMIYLGALIAGYVSSYLTIVATFGKSAEIRSHSVTVFGLRAPLGSFIAAWGALSVLVSAPFDNWWHAAYGLDVTLLSPPHTLLFLGLRSIDFGFLLLIAGAMNRAGTAGASNHRALQRMFIALGGLMVTGQMLLLTQRIWHSALHSSLSYKALAIGIPILFALIWRASGRPWAATSVALIYTGIRIAEVLIFPLFPATPRLGPVVNPITHLIPGEFPVLILVPAIALDLLWQHAGQMKTWLKAALSGLIFTATLVGVEWPFATFLATKYAANRFFGTLYFDYSARPMDRNQGFSFVQSGATLERGLIIAAVCAMISVWLGMWLGRWMRTLER